MKLSLLNPEKYSSIFYRSAIMTESTERLSVRLSSASTASPLEWKGRVETGGRYLEAKIK